MWKKSPRGERYPLQGAFSCSAGPCSPGFSRRSQRQGCGGSISWASAALPASTRHGAEPEISGSRAMLENSPGGSARWCLGFKCPNLRIGNCRLVWDITGWWKGSFLVFFLASFPPDIPNYPGIFAHPSWADHPSFAARILAEPSPEKIPLNGGISSSGAFFPCASGSLRELPPWDRDTAWGHLQFYVPLGRNEDFGG